METLPPSVLVPLLALCILPCALSLQCYECTNSPGFSGVTTCDSNSVTKRTCDQLSDRCMTTKFNFSLGGLATIDVLMKNCSSSLACDPNFDYSWCKTFEITGLVSNCTFGCCQGDLCNEPNSISTQPSTVKPAQSLECYECTNSPGFSGVTTCDSNSVTKRTCDQLEDRCMTTKFNFSLGGLATIDVLMKNCSSSLACDPDFAFSWCKAFEITGLVSNCTFDCCQGGLCNGPNSVPTQPTQPLTVKPAQSLECYECTNSPGVSGVTTCDSNSVTKRTCDQLSDRCLTMKYNYAFGGQATIEVLTKNCSSRLACDPQFEFNPCKTFELTGLVSNCTLDCCQGDLCNEPSSIPTQPSTVKPGSAVILAGSLGAVCSALVLTVLAGFN